jgi:thiamine kinase-like enzyme
VDRLFRDLVDQAAAAGAELPIVHCHRDLGPWNVLVEGDGVRVIDWEVARDGPALTDLVYASIHWTFEAHSLANEADRRRELRRLFSGQENGDAGPSSVRAAIRRSIDALRIDQRLVPPLVVLTMVGQALDRFDRLARVGRADPRPWLDNRYAGYVAELAAFGDGWISDPTRCVGRA